MPGNSRTCGDAVPRLDRAGSYLDQVELIGDPHRVVSELARVGAYLGVRSLDRLHGGGQVTTLTRNLARHYARAQDEAYSLIREALTTSGDICPADGALRIRLDPLTAPRRTRALAALCEQLTAARTTYPGNRSHTAIRSQIPPRHGMIL